MKSRELIQKLQEVDPSGELDVCIENTPIIYLHRKPSYWDGKLQQLVCDQTMKGYNVIGAKITTHGEKIELRTLSIDEAIFTNPSLPVDLSEVNDHDGSYAKWIEASRESARKMKEKSLTHILSGEGFPKVEGMKPKLT